VRAALQSDEYIDNSGRLRVKDHGRDFERWFELDVMTLTLVSFL
jgi:hypothetical protein